MRPTCGVHVVWRHFVLVPFTSPVISLVTTPSSCDWCDSVTDNPNPSCSKNRKLKEKEKKKWKGKIK